MNGYLEYLNENSTEVINLKGINKVFFNRFYSAGIGCKKEKGEEILSDKLRVGFVADFHVGSLSVVNRDGKTEKIDSKLMDSFVDINTGNYHIYPKIGDLSEVNNNISKFHDKIHTCLSNNFDCKIKKGRGIPQFASSKYVSVTKGDYTYWLCYEQLYLNEGDRVNSIAGKIQFFKTFQNNSINKLSGNFEMLYPAKYETACKTGINGHKIQNTDLTIYSEPSEIINRFKNFIE